jgi:DNA-directed RNA polymerase subunit RPC12/RpoP
MQKTTYICDECGAEFGGPFERLVIERKSRNKNSFKVSVMPMGDVDVCRHCLFDIVSREDNRMMP